MNIYNILKKNNKKNKQAISMLNTILENDECLKYNSTK